MRLGRWLGRLLLALGKRRRRIAQTNIRLAFAHFSAAAQSELLRRHFESMGMAIMELGLAWWRLPAWLARRQAPPFVVQTTGVELIEAATRAGRGVLLVSAHFGAWEIGGVLLGQRQPLSATFRPHENAAINQVMTRGRERTFPAMIARHQVRRLINALKSGAVVWYAGDQNYGHPHGAFVPFFGVMAATSTAASRYASISGAQVLGFYPQRLPNDRGYRLHIAPIAGLPSDDPVADARRINRFIERCVAQAPEQYFWLHRRFKNRPAGEPPLY